MQVRPPTEDEMDAVAATHVAAAEAGGVRAYDHETVESWAKRGERSPDDYPVDDPATHFVVAVTGDGEVAGFGKLVPDEREVRSTYVHPTTSAAAWGARCSRIWKGTPGRSTARRSPCSPR